jgi:hypothetical protein
MLEKTSIPHLYVRSGISHFIDKDTDMIYEEFGTEIEKQLIDWITTEHINNYLFKEDWWKPFRDRYDLSDMNMGYKKMFLYRPPEGFESNLKIIDKSIGKITKYCFQLGLADGCGYGCLTCNGSNDNVHFILIFYGYTLEGSDIIEPFGKYSISDDDMMPEGFWQLK